MPNQPSDIFSLAWFASPYRIPNGGGQIKFTWSIDYSFVWGNSGVVSPGVVFEASQVVPCDLQDNNSTTFSMTDNTPRMSPAVPGGQPNSLTINEAGDIPNNVFTTGIGMSGQGNFVQLAQANTTQTYTPKPIYFVAAGNSVQMGQVLATSVVGAQNFEFSNGIYNLKAVLGDDQKWTVSPVV